MEWEYAPNDIQRRYSARRESVTLPRSNLETMLKIIKVSIGII
jgi:hypothetical protein